MSQTMTAAVLHGKEDVRIEQLPVPQPQAGEVLLRIQAATTCGTDVKVFKRGYHAKMIRPPAVFGHEMAGVIERVGPGVTGWRAGQRVVPANSAPCGQCFWCQRLQPELCDHFTWLNGAYAEYVCVPARIVEVNLQVIPEGLPFEHASLAEPLACVVKGFEQVRVTRGETVVVIGAGPIGLMFVALAHQAGAHVIALDLRPSRLALAEAFGAQMVVEAAGDVVTRVRGMTNEGRGPDVVIESVGLPATWEQAIALVRKGGRVQLFGGCPAGTHVSVDTQRWHYEQLTLLSSFHHTPQHMRRALDLLASGAVPGAKFIGRTEPLVRLPDVLQELAVSRDVCKIAIKP
ncbi:MAG: zinc-binding dehydrogenase [Verrucomicrobiae bacterium]|nr:zinc-binding dehydrogenase [Verrucomicrobiae bacterium]